MRTILLSALLIAAAAPAAAAVTDAQPGGFEIRQSLEIAAPPAKVFAAMVDIGAWWSPSHSFSHDARNISIEPRPGGCWCEAMPNGGGVRHMTVVAAALGKELVFFGALGPLQSTGASGHMSWALAEKDGRTTVTWTYDVGGYARGGLDTWAAPVDQVLGAQLFRLKAFVETGKPE